ncbi:hypothetical protein PR202_ga26885 [Eleusine coracana subsp. coracana]|uniref:Uncharacterized protein n=1 Tax=Eleusine coracana subsp. coracana TaxID=191504 RepID=A0AAV5DD89_ELECO|nr:hypothetical protein PR202_ga26885 [Eleusine coracana subsp. coracana]
MSRRLTLAPWTDVLYDSDLIASQKKLRDLDDKPRQVRTRDGWRAVTWTRAISSNCWHKGRVVDVDDISVDDAMFSSLVSELGVVEREGAGLKFRDLYSAFPTLSTDGDDLLYLKTVVKPSVQMLLKGCVVAVDLGEKKLKAFQSFNFARHDPVLYVYHPCSLSKHLGMTSGT